MKRLYKGPYLNSTIYTAKDFKEKCAQAYLADNGQEYVYEKVENLANSGEFSTPKEK